MSTPNVFDKIKRLLESGALSDMEKGRINLLAGAVKKNIQAYTDDPTAANKRNLDASDAGLSEVVAEIWSRVFPDAADKFKNRLAVVDYLQGRGFKVKKSKVYKDVAGGLLLIEKDGSILKASVERYIDNPASGLAAHIETVNQGRDTDLKDRALRIAELKEKKLEKDVEKITFELEKERGLWLPLADFEMELAARASVLDQGLKTMVQIKLPEWVVLVGGKLNMASQLRDIIYHDIDNILTAYVSTKNFQIMFELMEKDNEN